MHPLRDTSATLLALAGLMAPAGADGDPLTLIYETAFFEPNEVAVLNVFGTPGTASRTLPFEALAAADPDVVFVACCGFTLERSRAELAPLLDSPAWRALRAVASGNVWMTDGNAFFSRPGPRLADSAEILGHALHPDIHPAPAEPAVQP